MYARNGPEAMTENVDGATVVTGTVVTAPGNGVAPVAPARGAAGRGTRVIGTVAMILVERRAGRAEAGAAPIDQAAPARMTKSSATDAADRARLRVRTLSGGRSACGGEDTASPYKKSLLATMPVAAAESPPHRLGAGKQALTSCRRNATNWDAAARGCAAWYFVSRLSHASMHSRSS